ncbi:MAG: hypothetical protein ACI9ND_003031 [Yoonia sp.]|jgi:hypothetical protein
MKAARFSDAQIMGIAKLLFREVVFAEHVDISQ